VRGAVADATGAYLVSEAVLRKYGASGSELWTRQVEFSAGRVAAHATGVYVAGADSFRGTYTYLRKYSPARSQGRRIA
jgi:hypothetical protein